MKSGKLSIFLSFPISFQKESSSLGPVCHLPTGKSLYTDPLDPRGIIMLFFNLSQMVTLLHKTSIYSFHMSARIYGKR